MTKFEKQALKAERRAMMEGMRKEIPFGDRIKPDEKIEFFSMYEFRNCEELFSFLGMSAEFGCDVYFRNEDVWAYANESKGMTDLKFTMYMIVKEVPEIGQAYLRYLKHESEEE